MTGVGRQRRWKDPEVAVQVAPPRPRGRCHPAGDDADRDCHLWTGHGGEVSHPVVPIAVALHDLEERCTA